VIVTDRSYLTAGLAAVSVAAVVGVPIAAHPPAAHVLVRSAQVQVSAAESKVVTALATLSATETRELVEAARIIVTTPVAANTHAPKNTHAAAPLQAVVPGAGGPAAGGDTDHLPDAEQRSDVGATTAAADPRVAAIVAIGRASITLAAIPAFVVFDLGVTAGQLLLDLVTNVNDVVPDLAAGLKLTVALNSSLFQSETKVLADSIHELFVPTSEVPDGPDGPAMPAMKSATQSDALTARVHLAAGEQTARKGLQLHIVKGATAKAPAVVVDTKDAKASGAKANTEADNGSVVKSHPAAGIASHIRHTVRQATKRGAGEHKAAAGVHRHVSSAGANAGKKSRANPGK
jgi:hypothetical protein